jgi:hypothetical protein
MQATLYVQQSMEGTVSPKIVPTTLQMGSVGTAGKYTLFEGSTRVDSANDINVLVAVGGKQSASVNSDTFVGATCAPGGC